MSWLNCLVIAAYSFPMLGGRRMSPGTLGVSLFAKSISTWSYLGAPGEMIAPSWIHSCTASSGDRS